MSTLRTVRLYGQLGARFGRVHRFDLDSDTPAEAVRALSSQFVGFREWLLSASERGLAFAVFRGKENVGEDDLRRPAGGDIRIAPVIAGAKRAGVLQTVLGAVLIVVGAIGMYTPFGQAFGGAVWGPYAMSTGIAMMAGGIVQMLSPQPKLKSGREASNQPSYVFNGAVNTEAQGHPVPLLYGRMRVGSAVASAGIEAADYAPATSGVGPGNPKWFPKNFYDTFTGGN